MDYGIVNRIISRLKLAGALILAGVIGLLLGGLMNYARANHEETGMFQGRAPCFVNQKGEPVKEKGVAQMVCFVVGMPGYPNQAWVFVELPPKLEVQAVFLVDKDFKIIRLLWRGGTGI